MEFLELENEIYNELYDSIENRDLNIVKEILK